MALSKRLLAAWTGCALVFLAATAGAQTTTKSTEYRNFEVISVDGNKVVYKSEKGIREVTLPDDFKLTMDGKTIGVHDLKPGMKGTAAITTTTTTQPVTVTEVRNAKVLATAGNAIIVRGQNGVRKFTIDDVADKNITIIREGEHVDLQSLRVGDMLTATIITRHPPYGHDRAAGQCERAFVSGARGCARGGPGSRTGGGCGSGSGVRARSGARVEEAAEDRQRLASGRPRRCAVARERPVPEPSASPAAQPVVSSPGIPRRVRVHLGCGVFLGADSGTRSQKNSFSLASTALAVGCFGDPGASRCQSRM